MSEEKNLKCVLCNFVPSQDITVVDLEAEYLECQILSKPKSTTPTQQTKVCAEQEHIMQMVLCRSGAVLLSCCTFSTVSVISEAHEFKY